METNMTSIEKSFTQAREKLSQELQRQKEFLAQLELLPEGYKEKASTAFQQQLDKAKQLVEDTQQRLRDTDKGRQLAEIEVRVLKATAETAQAVSKIGRASCRERR